MIQGNMKAFAGDLEQWVLDQVNTTETYVTEQGDIEDWNNNSQAQKQKSLKNLKEFLDNVKNFIDNS
jgi:L-lactate utilization protein LutB